MNENRPTWLVSSGGRRGALVNLLKHEVRGGGKVVVCDASPYSAAGALADSFQLVSHISEPQFLEDVLNLCIREGVDFIVPTLDPELTVYAKNKSLFRDYGIEVFVSEPEVTELSWDKWKFFEWLRAHDLPTVETSEWGTQNSRVVGPVVAKPRSGSSSVGVAFAETFAELASESQVDSTYIVQERAAGIEFTVDFAVGADGQFLGAVPRRRIEVRAGEVSKGITVKLPPVEQLVKKLAGLLPGAYGVLNTQLFFDEETTDIRIIELNARVGGGYPLAHRAGADFFTSLAQGSPDTPLESWQSGLLMLRYDDAIFVKTDGYGLP